MKIEDDDVINDMNSIDVMAEDVDDLDAIYHKFQVYDGKGRHLMCICPLCKALEKGIILT